MAASQPGDVILDPFFGTGTTGAVAKRLGRHWIGIEREPVYIQAAEERIAAALPLDESALTTMQSPKAAPRVAFGSLVENGMICGPRTRISPGWSSGAGRVASSLSASRTSVAGIGWPIVPNLPSPS